MKSRGTKPMVCCAVAAAMSVALGIPVALAQAQPQPQRKTTALQGEYFLSRNPFQNPMCKAFTRNLNQFRNLPFDQCNPRLSPKFPEFSRPQWEEIPFDINLAETRIKSSFLDPDDPRRDEHWQLWLKKSEAIVREGKVRMWRTKVDLDGDGKDETLIRLQPGSGDIGEQRPPFSCDYNSDIFISESLHSAITRTFNFGHQGRDIIRFATDGRYYSVDWNPTVPIGLGPFGERPDIGATAGVVVTPVAWSGKGTSQQISSALDCIIDWVPTGRYHPVKPKYSR